MWKATAEEDLSCTECSHRIPSGFECLSQLPPDLPESVHRDWHENFCIECVECRGSRYSRVASDVDASRRPYIPIYLVTSTGERSTQE